ncbi:MAG: hypothetical protein KAF27_05020 [Porphyrobacter sp.]|nr:hypothetical protein [Porphyrobacter sp.]
MTFHDRRLVATRNVKASRKRRLMKQGAYTINLWSAMPVIELGTATDDWNAVGADMRAALLDYSAKRG